VDKVRIKAEFKPNYSAGWPERQMVGRGSVVTIIEFFYRPALDGGYPIEKVRYYDEWGNLGETWPDYLKVIE
jgi:hypothetical protein